MPALFSLRVKLILAIFLFLFVSSRIYDRSIATSGNSLNNFPILAVPAGARLLVVSPHPDDETLGAAGLIQTVLAGSGEVKVVFVTNGDGQVVAPLATRGKVLPRAADYIAFGQKRQVEAKNALAILGVDPENISFLGYPDRQVMKLWLDNWNNQCPLRTTFTHRKSSPYPITYNPQSAYCGKDVLNDLKETISSFLPDIIVVTHPDDDHPDHRASANFVQFALAQVQSVQASYHPRLYGYLIHYGYYPQPRGLRFSSNLEPPSALVNSETGWDLLNLSAVMENKKSKAVDAYGTQKWLLGNFLPSFVRKNEIYVQLESTSMSIMEYSEKSLLENGIDHQPNLPLASKESMDRLLIGGVDLMGWKFARMGNTILISASTRTDLLPGLEYRLLVKTPSGDTHEYIYRHSKASPSHRSFLAVLDLDTLGNPEEIAISADVRQKVTLDQTSWHILRMVGLQAP